MMMTAKTFPRLLSKKKIIMVIIVVILIFNLHLYKKESSIKGVAPKVFSLLPSEGDKVLVTYAYAEGLGNGGEIDRHNLHYFIRVGIASDVAEIGKHLGPQKCAEQHEHNHQPLIRLQVGCEPKSVCAWFCVLSRSESVLYAMGVFHFRKDS